MIGSRLYLGPRNTVPSNTPAASEKTLEAAIERRVNFIIVFGLGLLTLLHGTSLIKILIILFLNYSLAKTVNKLDQNSSLIKFVPILTWSFNLLLLFANETYEGYYFVNLHPSLAFLVSSCFPFRELKKLIFF